MISEMKALLLAGGRGSRVNEISTVKHRGLHS